MIFLYWFFQEDIQPSESLETVVKFSRHIPIPLLKITKWTLCVHLHVTRAKGKCPANKCCRRWSRHCILRAGTFIKLWEMAHNSAFTVKRKNIRKRKQQEHGCKSGQCVVYMLSKKILHQGVTDWQLQAVKISLPMCKLKDHII